MLATKTNVQEISADMDTDENVVNYLIYTCEYF